MKSPEEEIKELTFLVIASWAVIIFLLIFMSFRVYV